MQRGIGETLSLEHAVRNPSASMKTCDVPESALQKTGLRSMLKCSTHHSFNVNFSPYGSSRLRWFAVLFWWNRWKTSNKRNLSFADETRKKGPWHKGQQIEVLPKTSICQCFLPIIHASRSALQTLQGWVGFRIYTFLHQETVSKHKLFWDSFCDFEKGRVHLWSQWQRSHLETPLLQVCFRSARGLNREGYAHCFIKF